MRHFRVHALAAAAIVALALGACGSSNKTTGSSPSTEATTAAPTTTVAPSTTAPAGPATVTVTDNKLGKLLVDAKGMTLYRFDNDTTPGRSTCGAGACATTWPAATVTGAPTAGAGIDASKLTTFTRSDGATQLQIDGHPLYTFAGDTKPGDTNGQGILDKWYASSPDGEKIGDNS